MNHNNIPVSWKQHNFRSKAERDHAMYLESERQAGRIKAWEYERLYPLSINGVHVANHYPDFTVTYPNLRVEIHEIKGGRKTMTAVWALKRKLTKAAYPHIRYRTFGRTGRYFGELRMRDDKEEKCYHKQ